MENRIGLKKWLSFILAGFVGQLAWAIENNYFNVYVYDCTKDYNFITWMVIASAATATITTLLMGAVSDRLGKRKSFISFGYILCLAGRASLPRSRVISSSSRHMRRRAGGLK